MGNLFSRLSTKFVLALAGLFLIGCLPALFQGFQLNFSSYISEIFQVVSQVLHPSSLQYTYQDASYPLFPKIFEPWMNSMILFFCGFVLAFIGALAAAMVSKLLPDPVMKPIKLVLFLLESLPDVLIIVIFQIAVIWIYKQTDWLIFNVVSYGNEDKTIVLPVIIMAILPAIMLYRTMILDFEEEEDKPYIEVARGKGLKSSRILLRHIFRNAIIRIFLDSKYVLWFMLSGLLMVEYIFNVSGLTRFIVAYPTPEIFTVGLLMLFGPIFVFLALGQVIIEKLTAQEVEL